MEAERLEPVAARPPARLVRRAHRDSPGRRVLRPRAVPTTVHPIAEPARRRKGRASRTGPRRRGRCRLPRPGRRCRPAVRRAPRPLRVAIQDGSRAESPPDADRVMTPASPVGPPRTSSPCRGPGLPRARPGAVRAAASAAAGAGCRPRSAARSSSRRTAQDRPRGALRRQRGGGDAVPRTHHVDLVITGAALPTATAFDLIRRMRCRSPIASRRSCCCAAGCTCSIRPGRLAATFGADQAAHPA